MNRALLARTRPEFYDAWIEGARAAGVSEEDIACQIAHDLNVARSLLAGKCPKCSAAIARYVDYDRQQGPSAVPGAWVMYRCSTQPPPGQERPAGVCDFMIDIKE